VLALVVQGDAANCNNAYAVDLLKFENLFIRHLWCNSNAWRECSKLGLVKM